MFSDDGIDANRSRFEPQYVYYPDESTDNEIRFLFTTLKSTEHSTPCDGYEISIRNMPFSYDLSMLISEGGGDKLTFEDVSTVTVVNEQLHRVKYSSLFSLLGCQWHVSNSHPLYIHA
jgi:hypothetical protein